MGADRARQSFDATRRYRSVVAQQGRVTLEADANEAEEIRAAEARADLLDVVGPAGSPDDGFRITVPAGAGPYDFGIDAGSLYVGGVRVVLPEATTYEEQKTTEWLDFPTGAAAPDPAPPIKPPFDELVYLVVADQEVSAVEDHALREVALGGPDTTARTRLLARVMRAPAASTDCSAVLAQVLKGAAPGCQHDPATMQLASTGRLKVDFKPVAAAADPCEPAAQAGFLGAENQLIRLQVTSDGSLLWGYDNASFIYRGTVQPGQTAIALSEKPVDTFHRPRPHQWVEVLDVAVRLEGDERIAAAVGVPFELDGYDADANAIELPATVAQAVGADVFVRVWENRLPFSGDGATDTELVLPEGNGTGVVVATSGTAVAGDFWMVGVRPSNPTAILQARLQAGFCPPDGPNRWATALAVLEWSDQRAARVRDCRRAFDNLVDLTRAACCELTLRPGDDLQRVVDAGIQSSAAHGVGGLHVRFVAGRFRLDAPLAITALKRGHLTISGCGLATDIAAAGAETAIVASGWDTTTVRDLSIVAAVAGSDGSTQHLGGALTILDSSAVAVDHVIAVCTSAVRRAASCVTIRNSDGSGTRAAVRSCELNVGANQVGVLLVNTERATLEHNQVEFRPGADLPGELTRRTLLSNVRMGNVDPWPSKHELPASRAEGSAAIASDATLWFVTERDLVAIWKSVIEGWATDAEFSEAERRRIRGLIDRAVTEILHDRTAGTLTPDQLRRFREWRKAWLTHPRKVATAAGQGLVIGGTVATDVRVLHNTIAGAAEGIRVGLSGEGARTAHVIADRVQIIGNTIEHRVPAAQPASRAAIFVGNVAAATIRDNHVRCIREDVRVNDQVVPIIRGAEAIRVWGVPGGDDGHFLSIVGNISRHASIGINVVQIVPPPGEFLCQITQNLAVDAQRPIQAPARVTVGAVGNVP
jgi:hypothetical protein